MDRAARYYLNFLCLVLLGYALCNRGFAYVGVAPLYVGECLLLSGVALWLLNPIMAPLASMVSPWILAALMGWVGLRTLPYLGAYGIDALRDATVIGYGVFSLIVFGLIVARPERLVTLLHRYQKFCYLFLVLMPLIRLLVRSVGGELNLPTTPGSGIPVICLRMGPVMAHLGGIAVFLAVQEASWLWFGLLALNVGTSLSNRGGLLAFLSSVALLAVFRPTNRGLRKFAALVCLGLVLLAVTGLDLVIDSEGMIQQDRHLSIGALADQFASIIGNANSSNFDDTKQWRLDWWGKIIDYTFYGDYFYRGKGFGVNLADDDGVARASLEVERNMSLTRSPHNTHLTILARAGVPGLVLWMALNLAWGFGTLTEYALATRRGDGPWASLFLLLLSIWVAILVETSFDVYLEGPMGGIWFWTTFGVGWAASVVYHEHPEVLSRREAVEVPARYPVRSQEPVAVRV
jgi:hypothetical protein